MEECERTDQLNRLLLPQLKLKKIRGATCEQCCMVPLVKAACKGTCVELDHDVSSFSPVGNLDAGLDTPWGEMQR